jgi:hypothetical protein
MKSTASEDFEKNACSTGKVHIAYLEEIEENGGYLKFL